MLKRKHLIFTFVLAPPFALAANAPQKAPDPGPPMRVMIVRGAGPDCPSNCPEWISLEGTFVKETPAVSQGA
jgi:hypothetical protein